MLTLLTAAARQIFGVRRLVAAFEKARLVAPTKALTSQRTPKIQFAAVCRFTRGGAFFTYLSNQLIRSARMCSSDGDQIEPVEGAHSIWQQRMRTRLTVTTQSGTPTY